MMRGIHSLWRLREFPEKVTLELNFERWLWFEFVEKGEMGIPVSGNK